IYNVQYRNHRKALIIDNKIAVIGGRNIANEYFDLSEFYNFLDRDMTIHGSIVETISKSFEANFNSRWSSHIKLVKKPHPDDFKYRDRNNNYPDDQSQFRRDLERWKRNEEDARRFLYKEINIEAIRSLGKDQLS